MIARVWHARGRRRQRISRASRRFDASFIGVRRIQFLSRRVSMKLFGRRRGRPAADGYSVIDDQLSVTGDIQTEGTVRVDGRVEGSLHRVDTLIIGAGGTVVGNIEAREVVIGGDLCGDLTVTGRVEVQASATVR